MGRIDIDMMASLKVSFLKTEHFWFHRKLFILHVYWNTTSKVLIKS